MDVPCVVIGWDVGGWLGRKQAAAAIVIDESRAWRHVGEPTTFRVAEIVDGSVGDLLRIAWSDAPDNVSRTHRIVVAIDAPLSFPQAFGRLLAGEHPEALHWARELDNPLAYRDCDRLVALEHGKKPLSASFDKLGNNATVAIAMTARWRQREGYVVRPFDAVTDGVREVIEVYPALLKRKGTVVDHVRRFLPATTRDGTDEQDASLCATVGLAYAGASDPHLPSLVSPTPGDVHDGWIYAPSRAWVDEGGAV